MGLFREIGSSDVVKSEIRRGDWVRFAHLGRGSVGRELGLFRTILGLGSWREAGSRVNWVRFAFFGCWGGRLGSFRKFAGWPGANWVRFV